MLRYVLVVVLLHVSDIAAAIAFRRLGHLAVITLFIQVMYFGLVYAAIYLGISREVALIVCCG
jgi:hypothetical protein